MNKLNSGRKTLLGSIVALFMSFMMLVGTTFAWFTDTASSNSNVIQSGTLDVEMYWAEGSEDPESITWTTASGAIFDNQTWEPGRVEAKYLKIENKGTLAFK